MGLVEKLNRKDFILYEILRHPAFCWEFINTVDKMPHEDEFRFTEYQNEFVCDFNKFVSLCCARAIGKCLDEDTRLLDTTTGEYKTIKEWYSKTKEIQIPGIDSKYNLVETKAQILDNGIQDTVTIETKLGYKTTVTNEHPFLTPVGWVEASKLKLDSYIAIPNELPFFGSNFIDELDLKYLAYFIAEGSRRTGSITTKNLEILDELKDFAKHRDLEIWDSSGSNRTPTWYFSGVYNLRFLEKYNIKNCYSYEKFVPEDIFTLNKKQVGIFLNRLFCGDGWVINTQNNFEIGYGTTSEQLARDIKHLLIRFGITSSLSFKKNKHRGIWNISIKSYDDIYRFYKHIGFYIQRKQSVLESIIDGRDISITDTSDIIPLENYRKFKVKTSFFSSKLGRMRISLRPLRYLPTRLKTKRILNSNSYLEKMSNESIRWVKIKYITRSGKRQTYSIADSTYSTLVADDIISHNTESITGALIWTAVNNVFPDDYATYLVPNQSQLQPVWQRITRLFRHNSVLKTFVTVKSGINSSNHSINLLNGSMIICRIAGSTGDGKNVIGLHTPFEIVDEAAYFPWGTFIELKSTLNNWTPGVRQIVSGVPNGLRENNVLYFADMASDDFTKHRIPAHRNPRYSEESEAENRELFGEPTDDTYIQLVLGRHGKPTFAVFDRSLMKIGDYPIYKSRLDGIRHHSNLEKYVEILSLIPALPKGKRCVFGIDLGYTDPTAIIILSVDNDDQLKFHARVTTNKVPYPIQALVIDYLDSKFNPMLIGMDEGHAGIAAIQNLQMDERYKHKKYKDRIIPVKFNANIVLGFDEEGKEVKEKTRPYAISVLQEYSNEHKLIYSSTDLEIISELERMVYVRTPSDNRVYRTLTPKGGKKASDHLTSGLLCATMAWYLEHDSIKFRVKPTKLANPGWNR